MTDDNGPESASASGIPEPPPWLWRIDFPSRRKPRERADAARNRQRVLDAATRLFAEHGVESVTMDRIAAEAGVGKGTLFRRFGDKSGLAAALLGEREAVLQEAMIYGTPPLGPGAPPGERLLAFVGSYADFLEENLDLLYLSETSTAGARYRVGAYLLWHHHVEMLLRQARPDLDAEHLAHALLAPLGAEHYRAIRKGAGPGRLRAAAESLARLVLSGKER